MSSLPPWANLTDLLQTPSLTFPGKTHHSSSILPSQDSSAAAAAEWLQWCPTLCDTRDGSPPGSPIPGILQTRTLEWVAISFSNAWKWKVKVKSLSHVQLFTTLWTAAYQAPLSTGFSRQEYWSGVPLHSPEDSSSPLENYKLNSPEWLGRAARIYIHVYTHTHTPIPLRRFAYMTTKILIASFSS